MYHGLAHDIIQNLVPCDVFADVIDGVSCFVGSMSKVNLLALTAWVQTANWKAIEVRSRSVEDDIALGPSLLAHFQS